MKRNLIMKERIQGLRKDRKLTLEDVVKGTGIPKATLNRLEYDSPDLNAQETRVGYQDIVALAKFYDVSTDYLCGLTENLTHRNVAIDKLRLSDEAIAELISGKLNTRLLSEIIVHPDFAELLATLEVYIDRTVSPKMEATNKMLDIAVDLIKKKTKTIEPDEYITAIEEGKIDPDDYLRFRLSQRFEKIARSLYETHAIETQDKTSGALLNFFNKQLERYEKTKEKTGSAEEAKLDLLANQMGVDLKKSTEEEKRSLLSLLSRSKFVSFFRKRK